MYDLRSLENYTYVDELGKDQGVNIRHKVRELMDFVQDDDRLREERKKAKKNKDKYVGMSSGSMGGRYGEKLLWQSAISLLSLALYNFLNFPWQVEIDGMNLGSGERNLVTGAVVVVELKALRKSLPTIGYKKFLSVLSWIKWAFLCITYFLFCLFSDEGERYDSDPDVPNSRSRQFEKEKSGKEYRDNDSIGSGSAVSSPTTVSEKSASKPGSSPLKKSSQPSKKVDLGAAALYAKVCILNASSESSGNL